MVYIGYIILGFTALQLLIAASNLVFFQHYPNYSWPEKPLVSLLIPARNEEKNIGTLLADLQKQDYKNVEILVFDDQSGDQTPQIVREAARSNHSIRLLQSGGLPKGWLGKNYACHKLAQQARGQYLLFLDADVRIGEGIIQNAIGLAQKHRLSLLSIFPLQRMHTRGEKITVPNMNYILLSLLPLILVRTVRFPSVAAANGQFMLFCADDYRNILPHQKVKNSPVEDILIARLYKKKQLKTACLTGNESVSCRMYTTFDEAIAGFSKNVTQFFGGSFVTAFFFWLITTFGFIPVYILFSLPVFIAYLAAIIATRVFISLVSRQSVVQNLALLLPQQLTLGLFIARAFFNTLKNQYTWKDRTISAHS